MVLRRLAIFVGHFILDALAVVTGATVDQVAVFAAIGSLVAKSMVTTRPIGAMMRYQLLDTTRAYARGLSAADAEFTDLAARHAACCRQWIEQTGREWPALPAGAERASHFAGLNNVRAALEWCFGANGNAEAGVGLAAAAVPVFWGMPLLPECHRWSERALLGRLQGYPAQAAARIRRAIDDVQDHPVALTDALAWAIGVFFWAGDLRSAEACIRTFLSDAQSHSLGPNVAVGQGLQGQWAILQGDTVRGVGLLRDALETLRQVRYGLVTTEFNISLARGLAACGRHPESDALINETITSVRKNGDLIYLPELFRVKGRLLLATRQDEAELWLKRSLGLSRRQGARGWELRTATDLATLYAGQRRPDAGRALLQPVLAQFTERADTADVRAAASLLATLAPDR